MKIFRPFHFAALAVVTFLCSQASADDLTFVQDIPTDILFGTVAADGLPSEAPQGTAASQATFGFRNLDDPDTEGTRTRGQSFTFTTGDGLTHDIGSLSVSLNNPINNNPDFRPDGQLEVTIFEWDSSNPDDFTNWLTGSGGVFTTGHVELYRESFTVLGSDINDLNSDVNDTSINDFLVQISFDAGKLQLTDGTTYGFLFRYTLDELVDDLGEPLTQDVSFAFDSRQDNTVAGGYLNTTPATDFSMAPNGRSDTRDMNFFFTAPSSFVLGDASLNGVVDFDDIAPFITILAEGTFLAQADIDGSLEVDFDDIAGFIQILAGP
ncbi:hypothetical protein N9Y42_05065 [Mariniblastus sp.]|nr:hypothetical protein [Mariniblastus sp.]